MSSSVGARRRASFKLWQGLDDEQGSHLPLEVVRKSGSMPRMCGGASGNLRFFAVESLSPLIMNGIRRGGLLHSID